MAAVNREILKRTLNISVADGVGADGSARSRTYSYNGLKTQAADEALLQAGEALGALMAAEVQGIRVSEVAEIVAQA